MSDQPSPLLHKAISQAQGQGQCTINKMGHSHITQRNNEGGYRGEGGGEGFIAGSVPTCSIRYNAIHVVFSECEL